MALLVNRFQPVRVRAEVGCSDGVFTCKRRVADDRVEPSGLAGKHLWELDLPVERHEGLISGAPLVEPASVALRGALQDGASVLSALSLTVARLVSIEEGR